MANNGTKFLLDNQSHHNCIQ